MGQLNKYEGPAQIFIEGQLVAEATSASFKVLGQNNEVATMSRQFAGKSDGPRKSEVTLENAVPRKGFERDYTKHVLDGDFLRVVFKVGGARYTFQVYAEDVDYSASVDAASSLSVNFIGAPPDIV